jgi:hypothetical protein
MGVSLLAGSFPFLGHCLTLPPVMLLQIEGVYNLSEIEGVGRESLFLFFPMKIRNLFDIFQI